MTSTIPCMFLLGFFNIVSKQYTYRYSCLHKRSHIVHRVFNVHYALAFAHHLPFISDHQILLLIMRSPIDQRAFTVRSPFNWELGRFRDCSTFSRHALFINRLDRDAQKIVTCSKKTEEGSEVREQMFIL